MLLTLILLCTPPSQAALANEAVSSTPARADAVVSDPTARTAVSESQPELPASTRELSLKEELARTEDVAFMPGQLVPTPVVRPAANLSAAQQIEPRRSDLAGVPFRPASRRTLESAAQRRTWWALAFAGHGAAAFDAWSTRQAISQGRSRELNPLLRPFSHSGALYVAIQGSPALMDYLGHRMVTSQHRWVRRLWWLPQSAGTAFSLASGVHNLQRVP